MRVCKCFLAFCPLIGASHAHAFDWCHGWHAAMLSSGHQQHKDKKGTTGGQQEKKRTKGGKNKGQKADNRRTRSGDWLAAAAKLVSTKGQQEDKKRARRGQTKIQQKDNDWRQASSRAT